MLSAFIAGLIGVASAFLVGNHYLGLAPFDVIQLLLASNVAGMVALLVILNAQLVPVVKKALLPNISMTWVFFLGIYAAVILVLSPRSIPTRDYLYLMLPLILSTGFCILVFGPIQDRIVRWRQRTGRM